MLTSSSPTILLLLLAACLSALFGIAAAATTVTTSAGTTSYTEGNAAGVTKVDALLALSSDSLISKSEILLSYSDEALADSSDALSVSPFNGLSQGAGYNSAQRLLTVTGLGTAATYQSVLRTVSFYSPSKTPKTSTRTLTFKVYDSDGVLKSTATKTLTVSLVDNVPTVTLSSSTSAYTERQGLLVLDAGLVVGDPDSTNIEEAELKITSGYDSGKDVLDPGQDVTQILGPDGVTKAGLTSTFTASTGTLVVTGSAPLATYQALLRKCTFKNDAYDASNAERQVTFKVKDGTTYSTGSILTIAFTATAQAPVLAGSSTTFTWTEGDAAVVVDGAVTVTDQDSTSLTSAQVTFLDPPGHQSSADVLSYDGGNGITGTYDSSLGRLTLSGTATLATYQAALRQVKFVNNDEKPTAGERTVEFVVYDQPANGNEANTASNRITRTFTVASVNDKPTLTGSTTALSFNGLTVTLQDSAVLGDPDHSNLAKAVVEITGGCLSTDTFSTATAVSGILMDTGTQCKATFTGSASVADYQALLRGVRLTLASGTSFERIVKVTVSDGTSDSDSLTRYYYALDNLPTPTITSTTAPETSGGTITIVGTNFGPASPNLVTKVQLGLSTCTSVSVAEAYTKITCTAPAGTGKDIAVVVTVGDKKSTPFASFTYQNPTVTSITSVATAGGTVTITGTNFGPAGSAALQSSAGGSIVVAGKACTSATVTVAHTTITCSQMEGTGGSKDVTVTVSTLSSGATGNGKFSYSVPSISTKALGSFLGYTTTFTGTNFGPKDTSLTVTITPSGGGTSFACTSATVSTAHTEFTCTMPAASVATAANTDDLTKLYDVQVVCDSLTGTGSSKFQYEGPVITSIGTVSFHGAEVTITGRNFGPLNQAVTRVNIGSSGFFVHATVGTNTNDTPSGKCTPKTSTEHTTICAYFKDYKTTGNTMTPTVSLVVGGQTSNTFTAFSYEGPVITGTSTGSQFGGGPTSSTAITITGRNFGPARTFGNADATYGTETLTIGGTQVNTGTKEVVSDTQITATTSPATSTAPLSTQGADISMTLFNQASSGGTGKFSYIGPVITSVSSAPTSGGVITITGDNFGPVKATADYFNTGTYSTAGVTLCADATCSSTIACTNPQVTTANTKITCTMGTGVPINTKITVKMFDGTLDSGATGNEKLVVANPTVASMTPANGIVTTGGEITVTGTSFGPAGNTYVTVKAGTYDCSSVTVVSHTSLKCTVPAGFGGNLDLQVKLTNGASITSSANTVFKYAKPTVTSVTSVDTVGGTVTITGTNFGPIGSSVESVTLNSAAVSNPSITEAHTKIVGSYTTGGTGTGYPAIVTMGGQASDTNTLFSYNGPTVTSITTKPSIFGGSLVLAGTNLGPTGLSATKISVTVTGDGTTTCSSPTVSSHTSLTCTITCSTVCNDATRDVSVTIDGQTSGTTGNGLLKYEGPVITAVPAINYHGVKGNTPVVITGKNFGDGTHINSIKMCALTSSSTCTGSASYTYGKEFETATTVSVVTSGTQIQGYFKEHIGDDYSVVVTVNNIQSTGGDGILDFSGPTITVDSGNLIATTVPTAGGTLTVSGTNFGPVGTANIMKIVWDSSSTAVTPAGSSATVATANTAITFTAPPGAGTKTFSFTVSVNGTTAGALATNAAQMRYEPPTITSVTQSSTAGATVTITGTNFGPLGATEITSLKLTTDATTGTQVDFTEATVSVANTQITAKAPAGSGQGLAVTLVIGGQTATGGDTAFSYVAPAVTSVAAISTGPTWTTTGYGAYSTTAGAWVTITGTNFGPSQALTSLTIGGVECANPYITVADTQAMCLFGPGAGRNYDVAFSVNAIAATGGTAKFGYSIPLISSSTTTSYFGGDTVTITGTNFGPAAGDATKKVPTAADPSLSVTIAGNACTSPVISAGHTQITCTAPAYLDKTVISGVQVAVAVEGQTGTGEYAYSGPSITSVSDVSMFGGPVTVTGTNFGPTGSDANIESVFVGGVQQSLSTINPSVTKANTEIVFTAAAGTGSSLNVQLYIRGQNTGTTGNGLLSYYGPQVTSVSTIPTSGGTVTITGKHFGPVGTSQINFVTIDGEFCTNAQVTVATSAITCDFQQGIGQGYNVVVKLNGETSQTTGNGKFSYNLPTISSITPSTGGLGTKVTIEGADFGYGAAGTTGLSKTTVYFKVSGSGAKNYLTDVQVLSSTKITGTVPLGTGANQVLYVEVDTVVNTDGARFTYGTPTVTGVTAVGPMGGTITVTGTNFGPTGAGQITSVKFGSATCASATVTAVATTITCEMPKAQTTANGGDFAASDLDGDGLMDVVATIDGIASTGGASMFKFNQPAITQLSPTLVAKNEEITITGTNFGDHKSSLLLKASASHGSFTNVGQETNVTTISDTEIVMKVPTGFGKANQLSVLINGREADYSSLATRNVDFKIPTVSSTVPPATTEGGQITVVGGGFGPVGQKLQIDEVQIVSSVGAMTCTNMIVTVEDTEMTCDVLPGTGAAYNVYVTIAGQKSGATGEGKFSYPPPEVTSVAPAAGRAGDQIVVTGKNFGTEDSAITIKVKGVGDESCGGVPCLSSTIVKGSPHVQALCVVPVSVGKNVPIVIDVNGQESNGTTTNSFSYDNPIIGSVTTSKSEGTPITITGQNFGPAGACYQNYFESITVGSGLCSDSMVKKSGTEIVCLAPPGLGINHDVVVTMRGASSGDSGKAKLSYLAPIVSSASYVPTAGGVLTIAGENFGPVPDETNGVATPEVTITSSESTALPCTNITVSVGHKEITCNIAKGTGGNYSIVVGVGTQNSAETGKNKMSYHPPQPMTIAPKQQTTADLNAGKTMITVTGKNFGDDFTKLKLKVGEVFSEQSSIRMFFMGDDMVEVVGKVPPGAGENVPVRVVVDGVESVLDQNITFSYLAPYVTGVTPVGTAGGEVEISGGNFGPEGTVPYKVTLGGAACASPVTTENSTIKCTAPSGVGKDLDVFIKITEASSIDSNTSGAKKFRYVCPGIEAITGSVPDLTSSAVVHTITVTGTNFGDQNGAIKAKIRKPEYIIQANPGSGEYFVQDAVVLDQSYGLPNTFTKDYRLVFDVPPGFGNELPVVIEVAGQDSASSCEIPKPLPIGDNLDYTKLFSFPRPEITSVAPVATAGGVLELTGKYLGPVGSEGMNGITVLGHDGKNITCSNPTVHVADVGAKCDLDHGVGSNLPTTITVGGYASVTKSVTSYKTPTVQSISPSVAKGGETITVTGTNFGKSGALIGLSLMTDMDTKNSDQVHFATTVSMVTDDTQFTFVAPVSTGLKRGVQVVVPYGDGVESQYHTTSVVGLDEPSFSYLPPTITSMSKVSTSGGVVTITGTGFGSSASLSSMTINAAPCTNLKVVATDTSMTCSVAAGTGAKVAWELNVDGQGISGSDFSYRPSSIGSISPTTGAKGAVITIAGQDFGSDAKDVTVGLGSFVCTDIAMLIPHTKLTCRVPEGEGIDVPVLIDVNGAVSAPGKFSFTLFGCTDASAENFNPLATVLDASCVFPGCTNAKSVNFDAKANKDDGSCILDPVKVTMKVKLPFQDYLKAPEFHQNVFKDDLVKELGIAKERIMILGATPGSTVFDFYILDDPAKPAAGVASDLQEKIVSNEFSISYPVVAVTMKSENPDDLTPPIQITTKEGEPRVSEESIIGIAACTGFILIWALFYRQCMRSCSRCCGRGAEKTHKVAPEPATGYPEIFPSAQGKINYGVLQNV
ncbi:hypothetical protein A3770_03p23170 [Chloropicon primus]|uniref:IPT/TIG domain-containing protein n=8 Tax=Chloropicon primus TaxID=1764295 RepID=A0A5B8MH92_9CHLO|nr:hypothetical protein A3770_03p23170 [Chloropicon primus]|eukprot:QDZ19799.1 hypothetical protein A3770_03p23170 [Chloropicon primus]